MEFENSNQLIAIERNIYSIRINKENGHYISRYRIITDTEYKLSLASPRKILQRLAYIFNLYIDNLVDNDISIILDDLKAIAKKLRVKENYVEELLKTRREK